MTDDHNKEDKAVTRALGLAGLAVIAGFAIMIGGGFSVANASMTDTNAIAGGWTAIGAGFIIAVVGGVAAYDHAMILRRNNQHHEAEMELLTAIYAALNPTTEIDRKRSSR